MKITSKGAVPVATKKDGELKSVMLRDGTHSYPELDITDETTAESLRMFQDDMGLIEVEGGIPDKEQREAIRKKRAANARTDEEVARRKKEAADARAKLKEPAAPAPKPKAKPKPAPEPEEDDE